MKNRKKKLEKSWPAYKKKWIRIIWWRKGIRLTMRGGRRYILSIVLRPCFRLISTRLIKRPASNVVLTSCNLTWSSVFHKSIRSTFLIRQQRWRSWVLTGLKSTVLNATENAIMMGRTLDAKLATSILALNVKQASLINFKNGLKFWFRRCQLKKLWKDFITSAKQHQMVLNWAWCRSLISICNLNTREEPYTLVKSESRSQDCTLGKRLVAW